MFRVTDENTFAVYQYKIMELLEDMCRNFGKKLSKNFIWEFSAD